MPVASSRKRRGITPEDLSGQVFGRLTVIGKPEKVGIRYSSLCRCECGNEKLLINQNIKRGEVRSCGCIQREYRATARIRQMNLSESHGNVDQLRAWLMQRGRANWHHFKKAGFGWIFDTDMDHERQGLITYDPRGRGWILKADDVRSRTIAARGL